MGFGFPIGHHGFLHHMIWADHVFLFATDLDQLQIMAQITTDAIGHHWLRWKKKSLKFQVCGRSHLEPLSLEVLDNALDVLTYNHSEIIEVFGTAFDNRASTATMSGHRLAKAEPNYNNHSRKLTKRGSLILKLQARHRAPAVYVCFESGCWIPNKEILTTNRCWESKLSGKTARFRRSPEEDRMQHVVRRSTRIRSWMSKFKIKYTHQLVLEHISRAVWTITKHRAGQSQSLLGRVVGIRTRQDWGGVRTRGQEESRRQHYKKRKAEDWVHVDQRRLAFWEDMFVDFLDTGGDKLETEGLTGTGSADPMISLILFAICGDCPFRS